MLHQNYFDLCCPAVPSVTRGKEGSCWLTVRTTTRSWWHERTTKRTDILSVKKSLTFELKLFAASSRTSSDLILYKSEDKQDLPLKGFKQVSCFSTVIIFYFFLYLSESVLIVKRCTSFIVSKFWNYIL